VLALAFSVRVRHVTEFLKVNPQLSSLSNYNIKFYKHVDLTARCNTVALDAFIAHDEIET
jgi:hypothetical protein